MTGLLAHGGTGGLVVEAALVLGILVVFFAVRRRERASEATDADTRKAGP